MPAHEQPLDSAQGGKRVAVDDEAEGRVAVLRHEPLYDGHAAVQGADVLAPRRVGDDELRGQAVPLRLALPRQRERRVVLALDLRRDAWPLR